MVPGTTGTRVRERDVLAFVIAIPLAAAFGLRKIAGLSTKTATGSCRNFPTLLLF